MTNPNAQFIDGSWYNDEYAGKWYRQHYIDKLEPDWAKEYKEYYLNLIVAYTGAKPGWKILDMGSGVGQVMQAWARIGFENVRGVEISHVAVEHAKRNGVDNIVCGSVQNLPFADNSFDLVTSFALLEHIDESILADTLKEFRRVGKRQAHTIAFDAGPDPSHINIKTPAEWLQAIQGSIDRHEKYLIAAMPDPLHFESPVFICLPFENVTRPVSDWVEAIIEEEQKGAAA